jgi:TonB-dependent starch-binding outer membrane protein SusC
MKTNTILFILVMLNACILHAQPSAGKNLGKPVSIELIDQPLSYLFARLAREVDLPFQFASAIGDIKATGTWHTTPAGEILTLALANTGYTFVKDQTGIAIIPIIDGEPHDQENPVANVTGKVLDSESGKPLAEVNIVIKGTRRGVKTGHQGQYDLTAAPGDVLIFTYVGFDSLTTVVGPRTAIDISMVPSAPTLPAVEISGNAYPAPTKNLATSSIRKLSKNEFGQQPVTSPMAALQGCVAGVETMPTTGAPGNAFKITIRGKNSLNENGNYPLYIIDGIPVDSRPLPSNNGSIMNGGYDPLTNIPIEDIESIEVLKDGDATAIYGSRGANGVIVITTRRNSAKNKISGDFTAHAGIGYVANYPEMMTLAQYLALRREAFVHDDIAPERFNGPDLMLWDTTRNTDPPKKLLGGTSRIYDIRGNIGGNYKHTSFQLGGGYHQETSIFPGAFAYDRINGQFHFNHASSDKRFNLAVSAIGGFNNNNLPNDFNLMTYALTLPPNFPELHKPNGELNFEPDTAGTSTFINPLLGLKKTSESKIVTLFTHALIGYEILKGLSGRVNLGYTRLSFHETTQTPFESFLPDIRPYVTAESMLSTHQRLSWLVEPQLQYIKVIRQHALDLFLGTTFQQSQTDYHSANHATNHQGATDSYASDDWAQYKYASIIARIGYTFSSKYVLNLTGRKDGSSRFGPGNLWGNFGSIGAAWIFSNENFMRSFDFVSFGKIKTSYALTGNDQIGDYKYDNVYAQTTLKYAFQTSLTPTALYNPNYQWETTKKWEGAIELRFNQDRILLEVNYYRHTSKNQLIHYPLPATTGFSSILKNFEATIENTGWEWMLSSLNVCRNRFSWTTSANVSFPKNKLAAFPNLQNSSYAQKYQVGQPLSTQQLYTFLGIDPKTGTNMFLDLDGNNVIDEQDKQFIKNLQQTCYGGLNNTLVFARFELAILFQFSNRHALRYMPGPPGANTLNQPLYLEDRWRHPGDIAGFAKASQSEPSRADFIRLTQSDFAVVDGSFIRLKTLTASYTLPGVPKRRQGACQAKIFVQGQNLFTKTDYFNLDPETGANLPPLRKWTLGLQVKL